MFLELASFNTILYFSLLSSSAIVGSSTNLPHRSLVSLVAAAEQPLEKRQLAEQPLEKRQLQEAHKSGSLWTVLWRESPTQLPVA
jgi:hypothetical protein